MSKNKKIGEWGEGLAIDYLEQKGFDILERNYRYRRLEIDIIGRKDGIVVFIEVKTRTGVRFGFPETWVDDDKVANLLEASEHYIHERNIKEGIRFDVIAILKGKFTEVRHFEDAFH